ncbi:hypothetical protein DFH08DRAFT_822778 [Mycena albidolilacea]|uniref:AA9 family lytic polysaccharide monooxygenase n=1 Tax=Mycena albidolilacea TaxID=1033008 RepID=A0AAD6Z8A6_9AGAR|nr:hypothetical protein DFH08DRAFT_822778 [Mycena albidolilacea]
MRAAAPTFPFSSLIATTVSHGWIWKVRIGNPGKFYQGNSPLNVAPVVQLSQIPWLRPLATGCRYFGEATTEKDGSTIEARSRATWRIVGGTAHIMMAVESGGSRSTSRVWKGGNYLLRHEIIALHTTQAMGEAEFYPDCIQLIVRSLVVRSNGNGVP